MSTVPTSAPAGGNESRASELLAITWVECAISLIFVTLRFYTRVKVTRNLWWDDWVIFITMMLAVVFSALFTAYVYAGGARHVFYLDPAQRSLVIELNWVAQVFSVSGIATSKISVSLLIYRLQGPSKWRTWFLIFCSVSSIIFLAGTIVSLLGRCSPPKALWIPGAGTCWDGTKVGYFDIAAAANVTAWYAFIDFALSLTPVTIVWRLQLPRNKKIILSLLLGLGGFAGICAIVKATYIPTLAAKSDFAWVTVDLLIWNANEVNVIIWAACCPTIRPLFLQFIHSVKKTSGYARHSSNEQLQLDNFGTKLSKRSERGVRMDEVTYLENPLPPGRIMTTFDLDIKREEIPDGNRPIHGRHDSTILAA